MAKGQKRSNREPKKPKTVKKPAPQAASGLLPPQAARGSSSGAPSKGR